VAGVLDTIIWESSDCVGVTCDSIFLSTDSGETWDCQAVLGGDPKILEWTVPYVNSQECKIRVVLVDLAGNRSEEESDSSFAIVDSGLPFAVVLYPNGGETLRPGEIVLLEWDDWDDIAVVLDSVSVSTNGGGDWSLVCTHTGDPKCCDWVVPNTPSDSCLVKVIVFDAAQNRSEDVSDSYFAIESFFIRSDADSDGELAMGDAVFLLKHLYVPGSPEPSCFDAGDVDDDGLLAMPDAIYLLKYLYVPGASPPPPPCCDFPADCGYDDTEDVLGCAAHECQPGAAGLRRDVNVRE
jgi:hypothetical protein